MKEIQSLQNALNSTEIQGLTIHEKIHEDKRRKVKKYFIQLNGTTYSPVLDYQNMNHFILGFLKALRHTYELQKLIP